MIVVLDTNVIVSAAMSPGSTPDQILRAWRGGAFELTTSAALLIELANVLSRQKIRKRTGFSVDEEEAFVRSISLSSKVVVPAERLTIATDPDDDRVLEAAIADDAEFVVSGDSDLLELESFRGIAIVTPARLCAARRDTTGIGAGEHGSPGGAGSPAMGAEIAGLTPAGRMFEARLQ